MTKRILSLMLTAGLGVATAGTAASADPYCDHDEVPQPVYGRYANGSYETTSYPYDNYETTSYPYDPNAGVEPAPGTYWNGYVWIAGAYEYPDGVAIWVPGHWQVASPPSRGGWIDAPYARPHHYYRTARSYRWR